MRLAIRERQGAIAEAVRLLDAADVGIEDIAIRTPTLDDVFLQLTGQRVERETDEREDGAEREQPEEALQ